MALISPRELDHLCQRTTMKGDAMRRVILCLLLLFFPASNHAQQAAARSSVLNHVTVISGTGAPPASDMAIVIIGNRIAAVDRAERIEIPAGAQVIEGRGKFVIPGLADMHN